MKTRFINKIHLEEKHIPYKWMEHLVSNGKLGGVMLVFIEGFSETEINTKVKKIKEFCNLLKEGGEQTMDSTNLDKENEVFAFKDMNEDSKKNVENIKNHAAGLLYAFNISVPSEDRSEASRLMNVARTNLEQSVMWAVKALSRL